MGDGEEEGAGAASNVDSWGFNVLCLAPRELPLVFASLLHRCGLPDRFHLRIGAFHSFMEAVGVVMGRHKNPYVGALCGVCRLWVVCLFVCSYMFFFVCEGGGGLLLFSCSYLVAFI